jgi:hypothetical protein
MLLYQAVAGIFQRTLKVKCIDSFLSSPNITFFTSRFVRSRLFHIYEHRDRRTKLFSIGAKQGYERTL